MKSYKELMTEKFSFKGAVKTRMLDKTDERWVKDLKKKGWEIDDFILSSRGYEITIQHKKGGRAKFVDKTPEKALIQAAKKAV
tara:strand:+ start:267 stop:515 length:249 start_codon:yes stop_codon:yes gene_type:complete